MERYTSARNLVADLQSRLATGPLKETLGAVEALETVFSGEYVAGDPPDPDSLALNAIGARWKSEVLWLRYHVAQDAVGGPGGAPFGSHRTSMKARCVDLVMLLWQAETHHEALDVSRQRWLAEFEAEQKARVARRAELQPPIKPEAASGVTTRGFAIVFGPGPGNSLGFKSGASTAHAMRCVGCGEMTAYNTVAGLVAVDESVWCVDCIREGARGRTVIGVLPEVCAPCKGMGERPAVEDATVRVTCPDCAGLGIVPVP